MKIRSGFVSNSSSSSFIIAVPKNEIVCPCCNKGNAWLLQAISQYIASLNKKHHDFHNMSDNASIEEYFKDKLEKLTASKTYAENQLKKLLELEKNPESFEHYLKVKQIVEIKRRKVSSILDEAEFDTFSGLEKSLDDYKNRLQDHLSSYDKDFKKIQELIESIKIHIQDNNIYTFTIDNWATETEEALNQIIKSGQVKVLVETHT